MPSGSLSIAVLILAAGLGSRLGAAAAGAPKWLVRIGDGTVLAEHQLQALGAALPPESPRLIITGALAEAVDSFSERWTEEGGSSFETLHNPKFAEYNNWYSLLTGFDRLDEMGWTGWTLVMNGDLLCPPAWVSDFVASIDQSADAVLAVDSSRGVTDESMKVELNNGELSLIGKTGISNPFGEYIGLAAFSPQGRIAVANSLRELGEEALHNEWYEAGIGRAAKAGARITVWNTPAEPWVEIDDENDLKTARAIASAGSTSGGAQ